MPLTLNSFPQVPPSRNALQTADIVRYITGPAANNFESIETLVEALETALNAVPVTTRASSMPDSAKLLDRWVDPSNNSQEYICVIAYTSGNGTTASWESLRDTTATTLAGVLANANSPDAGHLSSLKSDITAMASDSSLTTEENSILTTLQAEIVARNTEIIASAVSYGISGSGTYTSYIASYATWLAMPPVPANPLPANFATNWNDLLDKEAAILALIRSTGRTLLATLNGDVTSIQSTVDDMAADNKITPQEKIQLKREYDRVKGEYTRLTALATSLGHTGASEYTTYVATYNAWLLLIDTTLSVFGNMATTTTIADVSAWNTTWDNYYLDAKALDNYVDTEFKADLDSFTTDLTTISNSVNTLSADGVISGGSEKRALRQHWQDIQTNDGIIRAQATTFSVALPSGYTSAYTNLENYLTVTLDVFTNMDTDTAVDRAVMETFFTNFRTQYGTLASSVATAQANSITTSAPAGYSDFTDTVDSIVSDGIISAGAEKQRLNALWADIQATHSSFVAQATEAGVSTADLQAKYSSLSTYLGTLQAPGGGAANFTITNEDTAIGSTAFYQEFRNYEASKAALSNTIVASMLGTLRESVQSVADMNNDGVITAIEKTSLKRIWDKYTVERNNAVTQADALTITTEKDAMTTAYTALESYLDSLDSGNGIFNSMGANTTLTTQQNNDWDVKWFDFETKIQALLTAIQSKQISNNITTSSEAFKHDGSVAASGAFNLANFKITNVADGTIASAGKDAVNGGQLFTEQSTRTSAISAAQSAVQANVDQEITDRQAAIAAEVVARDQAITDHAALNDYTGNGDVALHGVGDGEGQIVGTAKTQTLTNKTIDASANTLSNVAFAALTGVKTSLTPADHTSLATSLAIKNYGDANWGGGGGGGGGTVDLEWVTVGDADTTNTGTDVDVVSGTLALPAGKNWKWVKIVLCNGVSDNGNGRIIDLNQVTIDTIDNTSNFVIADHPTTMGIAAGDHSYQTFLIEGVPSVVDQDITVTVRANTAGTDLARSAYIVGIAAGDPQATEEYGVYDTGSTTAPAAVGVVGTRIDLTDGAYATSTFTFTLEHIWASGGAHGLTAVIKKNSGGEPYCIFRSVGDNKNQYSGNGSLATDNATVTDSFSKYTIKRLNISNELCFEVSTTDTGTYDYTNYMTGPKNYTGTAITSSNGTLF